MGSQRVGHDWGNELLYVEYFVVVLDIYHFSLSTTNVYSHNSILDILLLPLIRPYRAVLGSHPGSGLSGASGLPHQSITPVEQSDLI